MKQDDCIHFKTPQEKWQRKNGLISKSYKLEKRLAETFGEKCREAGTTQAAQITKMMKEFIRRTTMETLSYGNRNAEEIKKENTYYFGQLWDGNGNGAELLESFCISPDEENVVSFEIEERAENILDTIVRVTDIY